MSEVSIMERERFTSELWRSVESIYKEILAHPFLRDLTDGALPEDRYYVLLQSAFSLCKESMPSEKAPVISIPLSGRIVTRSRSIL